MIGSGWAARFLLNGWDVAVFDPAADAEQRLQAVLEMPAAACRRCTTAPCLPKVR